MRSQAGFWKDLTNKSINRRRLLASTAAAGIGNLLLASCSSGKTSHARAGTPATTAAAGKPQPGGAFRFSNDFPRGFDPHVLQATATGGFGVFYSTLVRSNPTTYELEPDLAAKWEVPSSTEIVFTLAPNIRWHDKPPVNGRALKVDDIISSYNRLGMIAKQRTLFDEKERKQAVREIVLYMIDHMPYSAIDGRYVLTASPPAMQGVPAESAGSLTWCNHYENIWVKR